MYLPTQTIKKEFIKADFIAGVTVALVLIPQSLAYAQLAGLPPQFGLYAALLPPIIASFFGSSKQLATGPVAVLSLMTFAALSHNFTPGSSEYVSAAMLLALLLGIFQLFLGVVKLGGLVSFLSHPVIYGFTNAAAIIIATSQLSKFFGVNVSQYEHHYQTVLAVIQKAVSEGNLSTLLFGIWAILLMYNIRSFNRKLPSVLITIVMTTLFASFTHYSGAVIGTIPLGLPKFGLPRMDVSTLVSLIPTVITMGLIGFTEAISVAQAISIKTKDRVNPNKELVGQGLANIVGSFSQSYVVAGSFSRTAVNFQAGGKSFMSSFFTSALVLLTLLFLTKFLYYIPQVVLAAVIVFSVSTLIDGKKIKHIWYTNKYDGIAAGLTFFGTLYFAPHLDKGIAIGVLFSIAHYLYRNVHPRIVFLSKYKDGLLHDVQRFKLERCENIAVIRLDAPLFFANASYFENEIINDVINNKYMKDIVIVASGINEIDATGEEMLGALFNSLKVAGKQLYISDMKYPVAELLEKTGFKKEIGEEHFFNRYDQAVSYIIKELEQKEKHSDKENCPLKKYIRAHESENVVTQDKRETVAYFYKKLHLYKYATSHIRTSES